MTRGRWNLVLGILAVIALLAGGAWIALRQSRHTGESTLAVMVAPALATELAGIPLREPVHLRTSPLTENYENTREHVPPYGGDGEMQDRERFATAALDPFATVDNDLGNSPTDTALNSRIDQLKNQFMSGDHLTLDDQPSIEALCFASSLDSIALLRAARGFQWLGLMPWADALDHAAITKALSSYDRTRAGDPKLLPLVHELDATRLLWDLNDNKALEKRFKLAQVLNPTRSVPARRAQLLRAIVLKDLHRSREGAQEITQAWADAQVMKDLTPRDTAELQWLSALVFFRASLFGQAEPYCRKVLELGNERAKSAAELDVICLEELGDHETAQEIRRRFHLDGPTTRPNASKAVGSVPQNR